MIKNIDLDNEMDDLYGDYGDDYEAEEVQGTLSSEIVVDRFMLTGLVLRTLCRRSRLVSFPPATCLTTTYILCIDPYTDRGMCTKNKCV